MTNESEQMWKLPSTESLSDVSDLSCSKSVSVYVVRVFAVEMCVIMVWCKHNSKLVPV